jgi:hypothetical protein
MTKTFAIGECCVGGIIELKINNTKTCLGIRNATWKEKATLSTRIFRWPLDLFNIEIYLNDLTTSYYASKIINWIQENTK